MYLDHLESPDEAVRVVQEGKSTEGAKMVAKYVPVCACSIQPVPYMCLFHAPHCLFS